MSSPIVFVVFLATTITPSVALFSPQALAPLFMIIAVSLLFVRGWSEPIFRLLSPVSGAVGIFLAWSLVTCLWTPAPLLTAVHSAVGTAVLAMLGLAASRCSRYLTDPERSGIVFCLVLGVGLAAVILLFEINSDYFILRSISGVLKPGQHIDNPQAHLSRGTVVLLLLLYPALETLWRHCAILIGPVLIVGTFAVLEEGKYASVLAIFLGFVAFMGILLFRDRGLRIMQVGLTVLVLGLPWSGHLLPELSQLEKGDLFNSARHRVVIWHFSLDRLAEHPWRGWGMDGSRALPGGDDSMVVTVKGQVHDYQHLPLHPHNGILQVWLELGLPGALLLIAALWSVSTRIIRPDIPWPSAGLRTAALISAVFIGCISFGIWQSWWQSTLWLTVLMFTIVSPARLEEPISG